MKAVAHSSNANASFVALLFRPEFLKWGPWLPLGATEWLSGGYEQRPSLGSFAVILHNPSVTIY